jgi:uncharacterized protein YlxP (DUF503 family)
MSATRIYSFESVISSACKNVLQSAGLTAYTSFDAPNLRKSRPRVDVEVRVGAQLNPPIVQLVDNGTIFERRNAAWTGQIIFHIITDTTQPGKQSHSDYRAEVRNILAVLQDRVNELFLVQHMIHHPMVETGTAHQANTDKGYEITTVTFDMNFSIQKDAWSLLDSSDFFPWNGVRAASDTDWVMQWIAQIFNMAIVGTNAAGAGDDDAYILRIASAGTDAANQAWDYAGQAWTIATAGTDAADQAYSLALQALNEAWAGTNLPAFPAWVMNWIGQTYNLSTAGTDAANSADSWGRDAFSLAVAGTNAAANALAGAAAAALAADSAQLTADSALTAAHAADQWGRNAFSIAVDGTNAAHSADSWARDAFGIAVAGTNAANQAWTLAGEAYTLAQAGTNAAAAASTPAWVMQWLAQTFNLSTAGTNAANEADSWARDAFGIAVAGTNAAAAAQSAADAANNLGGVAFTLAKAGTDAAHEADSWARDAYSIAVAGTNAATTALSQANSALASAQTALTAATSPAFWALETFQNYDTSPVEPNASAPLTNTQIAYGTNWSGPATFNGTSASWAQSGFSGTSSGWPFESFEQYNTGTVITAVTISAGTGWDSYPALIY